MSNLINFSLNDIGEVAKDLRAAITGKEIDDPQEKAELLYKLKLLENQLLAGQMAVNRQEAAHKSVYIAGWRPAIGYVFAFILAYNFIFQPLALLVLGANGIDVELPQLETGELMAIVSGMLGLSGMRTYDKKVGTSNGH